MKFIALAALAGAIKLRDDSDPLGRNVDTWKHQDQYISGYNGADEDEIMDNIFSKFSKEGMTPSGHKTGQKLLMKDEAKLAAGMVLESAHKLKPADVPGFLEDRFEEAWNHYDQNHEGWIRYEETHTFQRYLMGYLNKFTLAAGSITDMNSGGAAYPLPYSTGTSPGAPEATPVAGV